MHKQDRGLIEDSFMFVRLFSFDFGCVCNEWNDFHVSGTI